VKIDEQIIGDIQSKVNIVDVISKYVPVSKKGRNYVSVCPFHNDTNPSMQISEDKQIYKCFACGAGGNVFTFVEEFEKVSFIEAVKIVADFIGYDLSDYDVALPQKSVDPRQEKLLLLAKEASEFYTYNLLNSSNDGLSYFEKRGITKEIIENFKLGYADNDSSKILRYLTKKGYTTADIVDAGIGIESNGSFIDRFRGRVIFTLTNMKGEVVGFSGRKIDNSDASKYVNSNENSLFNKSACLYNFFEAKSDILRERKVYVVEGFMDVIALYKAGIRNAIATMGVALSKEHVKAIEKMDAQMIFSFDGDNAGQTSMYKTIETLQTNSSLSVLTTGVSEAGKDLDEIYNAAGEKGIKSFLNNTYSINEFKFFYNLRRTNLDNYSDKCKLIDYVAKLINSIDSISEKEYFKILACNEIKCSADVIEQSVDKLQGKVIKSTSKRLFEEKNNKGDRFEKAEIEALKQMLFDSKAVVYYMQKVGFMFNSDNRKMAAYIVDYYEKFNGVDPLKIIDYVKDADYKLSDGLIKIYEMEIPTKFNRGVFEVIGQRSLDVEIAQLIEEMKKCSDPLEKAKIVKEIGIKKGQLNEYRSKYVVEKGD
jgi:DNA primase